MSLEKAKELVAGIEDLPTLPEIVIEIPDRPPRAGAAGRPTGGVNARSVCLLGEARSRCGHAPTARRLAQSPIERRCCRCIAACAPARKQGRGGRLRAVHNLRCVSSANGSINTGKGERL